MSKSLFLNVGYKCNYDCVYCVIGGIQEEFNSDDFVSLEKIKNIDLDGYEIVWLTGGEPTIHPKIFDILDYFFEKGLEIYMQSNGSMLGNNNFFEKIKKYNIKYQLPLNSLEERIHNIIMKHKNAFNLTLNGIKNLISFGCVEDLTVKIILTKLNYNHLDRTIIFLINMGVKNFYISYPVLKGNFKKYIKKLTPTYSEIKPYIDKLVIIEKEYKINYALESFPYCMIKKEQYKNIWEIGQLNYDFIHKIDSNKISNLLNLSNNCFKKYGDRDNDRNCNTCKIIDLKERLNNISFLHKKLDSEINANCLDNTHKSKGFSCLKCNYNIICSGVSKKYISLFGFEEFKNNSIKNNLSKKNILSYINYVKKI